VSSFLTCSAVGSESTVARSLGGFIARTGADEIIVASQIFDHSARLRSYEILMRAWEKLGAADLSQPAPTSAE